MSLWFVFGIMVFKVFLGNGIRYERVWKSLNDKFEEKLMFDWKMVEFIFYN